MLGLFLSAVKWAGVMGTSGVGRLGEHGITLPWKGKKVAICFGSTKDKFEERQISFSFHKQLFCSLTRNW